MVEGLPIRVTRGSQHASSFSPPAGYRYDGLYDVVDVRQERGRSGHLIWRFVLACASAEASHVLPPSPASGAAQSHGGPPPPGDGAILAMPLSLEDARTRVLVEVVRRAGQPAFRRALLAAYQGKCAISGCEVGAVLEAAHIQPYLNETTQQMRNGLLLRSDVHTLFDRGLLGVDGDYRVRVSKSLVGTSYFVELNGQPLASLPVDPADQPDQTLLAEHREFWQL